MTNEQSALLKRLAKLPPFPPVALQLLTLSAESYAAIDDFDRVFKSDPALSADLLAVANSALFGLRVQVESIKHAVTLLGLERVKSLAFTVAMGFYMRTSAPPMPLVQTIWSHSIATAAIAESVAAVHGHSLRGIYTAGLLHDIGRFGLLMTEGANYAEVLDEEFSTAQQAMSAEKQRVSLTHTEAGTLLAQNWRFPSSLFDCIRCHHDDLSSASDEKVKIVQLACRFAEALGYVEFKRPEASEPGFSDLPTKLRENPDLHPVALRSKIKIVLGSVWPLRNLGQPQRLNQRS
jgi:putative nucleotidyltransferase with HDIG domain